MWVSFRSHQHTSTVFTDAVLSRRIALLMDGKGSWRENVFIERLWVA